VKVLEKLRDLTLPQGILFDLIDLKKFLLFFIAEPIVDRVQLELSDVSEERRLIVLGGLLQLAKEIILVLLLLGDVKYLFFEIFYLSLKLPLI
jgi:hypothetical protein